MFNPSYLFIIIIISTEERINRQYHVCDYKFFFYVNTSEKFFFTKSFSFVKTSKYNFFKT